MAEVRKSPTRRVWMLIFQAPVVVVGVGALAAVAIGLIDVTIGLIVFGAAFIVSVAGSVWFMRTFSCPVCGESLQPPRGWWHRFPGVPLLMRCVRCDVDWDFGLRGQQD